ncbi:MAG: sigma 54-interacting transcriptional regulator [Myxococcota bacterium]
MSSPATETNRTTANRSEDANAPPSTPAIQILYSPDPAMLGRLEPLAHGELRLGRGVQGSGLTLPDALASRHHATILWDGDRDRHLIRDERSANGTRLNGRPVSVEVLTRGDVVALGDTVLRYVALDLRLAGWTAPLDAGLAGRSAGLREVLDQARKGGPSDLTALIAGETGTGKELVARALHRVSGRAGPFVAVNCAAIPRDLLESELFGHVRGAFTGADRARPGVIRSAEGGTLLLDEIGELPTSMQAKLLRVIDRREVRAVGKEQPEPVDVRFVAATHRNLDEEVRAGRFRQDLRMRLDEWPIEIPPLRERPDDILDILAANGGTGGLSSPLVASGEFFEALALYDWPGNVRELLATVRAAAVRAEGRRLELEHLPARLRTGVRTGERASHDGLDGGVRAPSPRPTPRELEGLVRRHRGNVTAVAAALDVHRAQVYRWLDRHGIDVRAFRSP